MNNAELISDLVERARSDARFRSELIANPKEAAEKALGIAISPAVTLHIHEDQEHDIHVVLPYKGARDSAIATRDRPLGGGCIGW